MKFSKLHGCGNDYVFVDRRFGGIGDPAETARRVADRHRGVGSDGLILVEPVAASGIRVEMYNADGSRAPMCGNGVRCAAKFAVDQKLLQNPRRISIESTTKDWKDIPTLGGVLFPAAVVQELMARAAPTCGSVDILVVDVETDSGPRPVLCVEAERGIEYGAVDMAAAAFEMDPQDCRAKSPIVINQPVTVESKEYSVTCVSMGNMHAVVFVDDLGDVDVPAEGAAIESCGWFPRGVNVHFAQVESAHRLRIGIWERGSGATQACGSGACAVVAAGRKTGRTENVCDVVMPGGTVRVVLLDRAYLLGPTETAFCGQWIRTADV